MIQKPGLKKSLFLIFIITFAGLFSACSNFLTGSLFKEQLEADIAYANASSNQIRIELEDGCGSLLTESIINKKVSDAFSIEFKIAPDYEFEKWEAYSKSPEGLLEVLSSDYINFKSFNSIASDGLYAVNVEYKKYAENIVIKPLCYLIPKITDSFPSFDNAGYPQDSSIKIYFNKPINISDFMDTDGFLRNITITSGNDNLLLTDNTYYKNPYLEDDGKTLVIPSVPGNYLLNDGVQDINVTISLEDIYDAKDNLPFKQNNYSFIFRVNASKDSHSPDFSKFYIARTEEDARNGSNLINIDVFSHYAAKTNYDGDPSLVAENIHNHRVNKLWVYLEADDSESGVEKLIIEESLVYNKNGVSENGETYTSSYNNTSANLSYEDCFEYNFQTQGDGVIRLTFSLYDYSGNVKKETIEVIKDTLCLQVFNIMMIKPDYGYYLIDENGMSTCDFKLTIPTGFTRDNFIIDLDGNKYPDNITFDDETSEHPIRISKIEYGFSKENLESFTLDSCNYNLVKYGYGDGYYKQYLPQITFNPLKDLYIVLTSEDYIGNTKTYEACFPAAASVINWEAGSVKVGSVYKTAWIFQTDTSKKYSLLYTFENTEGIKSEIKSTGNYYTGPASIRMLDSVDIDNLESGIYYFYALPSDYTGSFLSTFALGNPVVIYKDVEAPDIEATELSQSSIPDFSVVADSPVLNSGQRHIRVLLNENTELNPNLKYLVEYKNTTSGLTLFSKDFEFDIKTDYSFYDFRLMIQNEAGENVFSDSVSLDLSFDNVSPTVGSVYYTLYGNAWSIFFPYCSDGDGVGFEKNEDEEMLVKYITSATALNLSEIDWINDVRVKEINEDSFWGLHIPYDGGNSKYIYIYLPDKNGNFCTFETHGKDYIAATPVIKCSNNTTFNVKNTPVDSANTSALYLTAWYLNDGEWEITEQIKKDSFYYQYSKLYNTSHSFAPTFTEIEKQSFIKINCCNIAWTQGSNVTLAFSDYAQYFYPPYYLEENFTCDLKSYLECADNEIAVFADKPCLVQTLYCSTDLGDSNSIKDWITYASEAGLVQKYGSFTYKIPVDEIPSGKYYTNVIHFADGSRKMTAVKQKLP